MLIMIIKKKFVQLKRLFNVAQDLKILNSHTLLAVFIKSHWQKKKEFNFQGSIPREIQDTFNSIQKKFSQKVISCYVKKRNLCQS